MWLFSEHGKVTASLERFLPYLCPSPCDLQVSLCAKAHGEGGGEAPVPPPSQSPAAPTFHGQPGHGLDQQRMPSGPARRLLPIKTLHQTDNQHFQVLFLSLLKPLSLKEHLDKLLVIVPTNTI